MKKIFLNTMAVLAAATLLTSCWDTMDDKASIDAAYTTESQVTSTGVTLTSATVKSYKRIDLVGSASNIENVTEMGFMVGEDPSMSGAMSFDATDYSAVIVNPSERGWYEEVETEVIITEEESDMYDTLVGENELGEPYYYYIQYSYVLSADTEIDFSKSYFYDATGETPVSPAKEGWYINNGSTYKLSADTAIDPAIEYYMKSIPSNFAISASGLSGATTYYVCAYAVTPSGVAISEVQQLTTPETPVYGISGYYFTTEFELDEDQSDIVWVQEEGMYPIYIEQDPDDETAVTIYNLWGANGQAEAIYDPENLTIYIAANTPIGKHPTYGTLSVRGVNASISAFTQYIEMTFTPKGGFMTSTPFAVSVSAGRFGFYYVEMEHMSDDEVAELMGEGKKRTYMPFTSRKYNLK
ncbi:MAG: hypothetical protein K5778_00550 [Bacteroidaceae bacterium]|nr:hypothetical protein [Bacteroidaceae bacterium]